MVSTYKSVDRLMSGTGYIVRVRCKLQYPGYFYLFALVIGCCTFKDVAHRQLSRISRE